MIAILILSIVVIVLVVIIIKQRFKITKMHDQFAKDLVDISDKKVKESTNKDAARRAELNKQIEEMNKENKHLMEMNDHLKDNVDSLIKEQNRSDSELKRLRDQVREKPKDQDSKSKSKKTGKGSLCSKCQKVHTQNASGICTVCTYRKKA